MKIRVLYPTGVPGEPTAGSVIEVDDVAGRDLCRNGAAERIPEAEPMTEVAMVEAPERAVRPRGRPRKAV